MKSGDGCDAASARQTGAVVISGSCGDCRRARTFSASRYIRLLQQLPIYGFQAAFLSV
jgi:hypothetical protein